MSGKLFLSGRILSYALAFACIITLNFFLMRFMPGDPVVHLLGEENLPAIPLYWDTLIQPYSGKWTGWKKNPMYGALNEETWFNLKKVAAK